MFLIDNIIISDDIFTESFSCNLNICKGLCCIEGDFGPPVTKEEETIINKIYPKVKSFLDKESLKKIEDVGIFTYYSEIKETGISLLENGACVFLIKNADGVNLCALEKAWLEGMTKFQKPISCHLYPIRVKEFSDSDFKAINYDKWEICETSCNANKAKNLLLYEYLKEPLIRKFGIDFYKELEVAAKYYTSSK